MPGLILCGYSRSRYEHSTAVTTTRIVSLVLCLFLLFLFHSDTPISSADSLSWIRSIWQLFYTHIFSNYFTDQPTSYIREATAHPGALDNS